MAKTNKRTQDEAGRDSNPDAITGAPGSHPVGTGVGAAGGGAAGAAIGSFAGPVGTAVGAVVGAVAGGLAGKGVAETIDPTAEDAYWRENYVSRSYVEKGSDYGSYAPAYRYGWESRQQHGGRPFDEVESDLRTGWERSRGKSKLTWDQARHATRDAWERIGGGSGQTRQLNEGETRVPVVEEELQVGKRQVERGGVRVRTEVSERPVEEQVSLREERATVERRPVDRPATQADLDAALGQGTIEVRESSEEAVVNKRARVVEEVVVGKQATQRTETVRDTVRRTDVEVEQMGGSGRSQSGRAFETYASDFRTHWQGAYGSQSGAAFDQYEPAYRYGYNLAGDQRYADSDWDAVQPQVRQSWEQSNPGSWERFKDSVRYAWDKVRGRR